MFLSSLSFTRQSGLPAAADLPLLTKGLCKLPGALEAVYPLIPRGSADSLFDLLQRLQEAARRLASIITHNNDKPIRDIPKLAKVVTVIASPQRHFRVI
jgi:hypothetical protein